MSPKLFHIKKNLLEEVQTGFGTKKCKQDLGPNEILLWKSYLILRIIHNTNMTSIRKSSILIIRLTVSGMIGIAIL